MLCSCAANSCMGPTGPGAPLTDGSGNTMMNCGGAVPGFCLEADLYKCVTGTGIKDYTFSCNSSCSSALCPKTMATVCFSNPNNDNVASTTAVLELLQVKCTTGGSSTCKPGCTVTDVVTCVDSDGIVKACGTCPENACNLSTFTSPPLPC